MSICSLLVYSRFDMLGRLAIDLLSLIVLNYVDLFSQEEILIYKSLKKQVILPK